MIIIVILRLSWSRVMLCDNDSINVSCLYFKVRLIMSRDFDAVIEMNMI